jgi:methionyl-tRNA synthetase
MLMAQDGYVLPADIPANEFLNLEGRKLSTSRNFAVWLHEYLDKFPPDPLRYAIAANMPETKDADFSWKEFQARNNNELADILGNFVNRTLTFVKKNYDNRVPNAAALTDADRRMLDLLQQAPQQMANELDGFEFRRATRTLMDLAREANKYFNDQEPWRTLKEKYKQDRRCDTTMYVCLRVCKALAVLMAPILPFSAMRLWKMLNLGGEVEKQNWLEAPRALFAKNHPLGEPEILFNKIEDETIAPEIAKLEKALANRNANTEAAQTIAAAPAEAVAAAPVQDRKPLVSIENFQQLDLRVAEILAAEKVEKADKLLKLKIRVGTEERQLIAGIALHYKPEELVGKKVVIVANLQPAKIRGVESQGMILAASTEDGKLSIVSPERDIPSGAKVK